jgi:hypothetical protein
VHTPDLFALFVRPLHRAGLRYMVSGSLASVHYGEPRLTMDVDVVVHVNESEAGTLAALFPASDFHVPPPEVVAVEINRQTRGHFNVIHHATGQKADFYPSRRHPYWQWAFERRQLARVDEDEVWFAPPEYVILWTRELFREGGGEKGVQEIRGMVVVHPENLDGARLDLSAGGLGVGGGWLEGRSG